MPISDLTTIQAKVLRAAHAQGGADLYDLSQSVGTGPRAVQEAVRQLAQNDLVHVSERGLRVECTRTGNEWVREHG